ncbi:hypothetical protein A6S26_15870 [Nostoc sp. ATCC 43529]|nr:hypothetical protein A6S26_15870 [Nostoc sp. ATCC 43529]
MNGINRFATGASLSDRIIVSALSADFKQPIIAVVPSDRAAQVLQTANEQGINLTAQQREEAAIAVYTAKAFVTKIGLAITTQIVDMPRIELRWW